MILNGAFLGIQVHLRNGKVAPLIQGFNLFVISKKNPLPMSHIVSPPFTGTFQIGCNGR